MCVCDLRNLSIVSADYAAGADFQLTLVCLQISCTVISTRRNRNIPIIVRVSGESHGRLSCDLFTFFNRAFSRLHQMLMITRQSSWTHHMRWRCQRWVDLSRSPTNYCVAEECLRALDSLNETNNAWVSIKIHAADIRNDEFIKESVSRWSNIYSLANTKSFFDWQVEFSALSCVFVLFSRDQGSDNTENVMNGWKVEMKIIN